MMRRLYAGDGLPFPDAAPETLLSLLREPTWGRCMILRDQGRSIGYFVLAFGFSLEFGGRDAFLDELYLIPEARGRGFGKAALSHAIDLCRTLDVKALHLETKRTNAAAQKLYRSAGFTERHPGFDLLTLRLKSSE